MQKRNQIQYGLRMLLCVIFFSVLFYSSETHRASAEELKKYPYLLKVNRIFNTVTVYKQDETGEYTNPVKAMLCSVGAKGQTKLGTFQTKEKYRWKLLMGDVWGQYSTRIVGGILFHSVYYYEDSNPATLASKEFNKLGTSASHGCIRLSVEDAKWIYDNCEVGTTVIIYDDKKSAGPLGKPESIKIAASVRWDPTDPDVKNPYNKKPPIITGVKNLKTPWNTEINLLKGVKAASASGGDLTKKITVKGKIDVSTPGKYKVTYTVSDTVGKSTSKAAFVTVENNKISPKITGAEDKIIGPDITVDVDYALSKVEAVCANVKLDKKYIKVLIDKISETKYNITYRASIGKGPEAVAKAEFTVDNEAPVFNGITDFTLEAGEYPSISFLMEKVTVTDNYTPSEKIATDVFITDNPDGTLLITYEAIDEAGNKATTEANIFN